MKRNKYNKIINICPPLKMRNSYRKNTIFVEGVNDKIVFDSIVSNNWNVSIYNLNGNKKGKEYIIEDFVNNCISNQIAVVDKDYDYNENIKNLYYTDYIDLESTAINLMSITETIKAFKVDEKISSEKFCSEILYPTLIISEQFSKLWMYFRNNKIKTKYLFNNDNYYSYLSNLVDLMKNEIRYSELEKVYKEKFNISNVDFKQIMECKNSNDKYYFRGHDFFKILRFYIKKKNVKIYILEEEQIERNFICNSICYKWIAKSDLYKTIKNDFLDCFI